jgi:YggT family protein
VNGLLCTLDKIVVYALQAYVLALLVYAIASWIPDIRGRWLNYLARIIEPLLLPIRRIVPPIGGLDLAFLILLLILQLLIIPLVRNIAGNVCYPVY